MIRRIFLLLIFLTTTTTFLLAQTQLDFEMISPSVLMGTPQKLQFEIRMRAGDLGTKHIRGEFYLNYDSAAFFSSMAGNNRITLTGGPIIQGLDPMGDPKYDINAPTDNGGTGQIVEFGWIEHNIANWTTSFCGSCFNVMPGSMTQVFHVIMDIKDINQPAGLTFNTGLMSNQFFHVTGPGTPAIYSPFVVLSDLANLDMSALPTLPVELSKFEAISQENHIQLIWKTNQEINNKGFFLERKKAGIADFKSIAWQDGQGSSSEQSSYQFTDYQVVAGNKYFYRLRQVDLDGRETYSYVTAAYMNGGGSIAASVFPNPAEGEVVFLEVQAEEGTVLTYEIFDQVGRSVATKTWGAQAGLHTLTIELADLQAGIYQLKLSQKDKKPQRFRIQKP